MKCCYKILVLSDNQLWVIQCTGTTEYDPRAGKNIECFSSFLTFYCIMRFHDAIGACWS